MTLETSLSEKLRERLVEMKTRANDTVTQFRLNDFSEYRYSAGYVTALDHVTAVMDEILEELQTKKTGE